MSIKIKILIPMVVLTILVAAAILVSNIIQFSGYVDTTLEERVDVAATVAGKQVEVLQAESEAAALTIAEDPSIVRAIESGNRNALLERAVQMQADTGVDFCTVTNADGVVLVRSYEPENYGDSIASQANIQSAMSGKTLTAIEQGTSIRISVRTGTPVYDGQDRLLGVVSTGYRLDTDSYVDTVKSILGCEVTIFLGDERVSTTVVKEDGTRAVGTKAAENVSRTVLAGNTYSGKAKILNQDALTKYSPLYDPDGNVIGMLFVGRYLTVAAGTVWSFVRIGLLITLILLAVSIPAILYIAGRIVAPIKSMVKAADALAVGDTEISLQIKTNDEVHELAAAFNKMIESTREQVRIIGALADGDFTVSIEERSDKDVMNNALKSMLQLNNEIFSQIVGSANQVSSGAKQMADSSQAIAHGVAKQTANVEQLSGSINEVNLKTTESAAMAERAAALAQTIKGNAQKGSGQMERMVQAVKEINDASQMINKIIKVIDDIAFQTNILALNAAVEAARAGQHGKGFSVVADEVRNLAAKSAEAAKDTGSLIENSIAKAELGAHIADETAASLEEIVSGINESGRIVEQIAEASAQQNIAITMIHSGIDQVTEVVQHNSSTAEESAAASEEMSGQAELLQSLVSRFRLKRISGAAGQFQPAPSQPEPPPLRIVPDTALSYTPIAVGDGYDKY